MAALVRASRIRCMLTSFSKRNFPRLKPQIPAMTWCAYSSTSKKANQSEFVIGRRTEVDPKRVEEILRDGQKEPNLTDPDDPSYVKFGFHADARTDLLSFRLIFFFGISLAMVVGPLYIHYLPEFNGRVWATREADLVIEERRRAGMPIISPDMCDPDKLVLPSPEEEEHTWKVFTG